MTVSILRATFKKKKISSNQNLSGHAAKGTRGITANFSETVKLQDIKLTHRNPLHSYTLMRKQKEKLRKQFHSPLQRKEKKSY